MSSVAKGFGGALGFALGCGLLVVLIPASCCLYPALFPHVTTTKAGKRFVLDAETVVRIEDNHMAATKKSLSPGTTVLFKYRSGDFIYIRYKENQWGYILKDTPMREE